MALQYLLFTCVFQCACHKAADFFFSDTHLDGDTMKFFFLDSSSNSEAKFSHRARACAIVLHSQVGLHGLGDEAAGVRVRVRMVECGTAGDPRVSVRMSCTARMEHHGSAVLCKGGLRRPKKVRIIER